jgi:dTDP-L-rhamnose 4-epimerase
MKKAVVTGGTGPVGSMLANALVEKGYAVRSLGTAGEKEYHLGKPWDYGNAQIIECDIRNLDSLEKQIAGADVIFHQAGVSRFAPNEEDYVTVNAVGTMNLFKAIKNRNFKPKVIYASTNAVYGEGKYACTEHGLQYPVSRKLEQLKNNEWELKCETCNKDMSPLLTDEGSPLFPTHIYALTKQIGEWATLKAAGELGIKTTVLRTPLIYGPRQHKRVDQIFSTMMYHNNPIKLNEDGNQLRNFVYVGDVVAANIFAAENNLTGIYNMASEGSNTLKDFVYELAQGLGVVFDLDITGDFREGDTRHVQLDDSKLRKAGFVERTSLEEGVKQYIAWIDAWYGRDYYFKKSKELFPWIK